MLEMTDETYRMLQLKSDFLNAKRGAAAPPPLKRSRSVVP